MGECYRMKRQVIKLKKHLLVIYHSEIENDIVVNLLELIKTNNDDYIKEAKCEDEVDILPLLTRFVLIKTPLKCLAALKDLNESLKISGLHTRLFENVFKEQFFHIMYKNMNEMSKISVAENVRLFEQLERFGF